MMKYELDKRLQKLLNDDNFELSSAEFNVLSRIYMQVHDNNNNSPWSLPEEEKNTKDVVAEAYADIYKSGKKEGLAEIMQNEWEAYTDDR